MRTIAAILVLSWGSVLSADTAKLPVTADVGICAHPKEMQLNTGGNARVRVKGNEHYYLFNFDTKAIANWKITKATLHLKLAGGHLRRVAFCTVPAAWIEGTAVNKPQDGSPCFTHVKYPTDTWGSHGENMMDVTFNSPYMRWEASDVKAGANGWLEIPIHPDLVQAVAAGLSHGLVMGDEKGQTRENHDIFTREQANGKPYLVVEGAPRPVVPSGVKVAEMIARPEPAAAGFDTGAIRIDTQVDLAKMLKYDPYLGEAVLGTRVRICTDPGFKKTVSAFVTFADPVLVAEGLAPGRHYHVEAVTFTDIGWRIIRTLDTRRQKIAASAALPVPQAPKLQPPETTKRVVEGKDGWRVELFPATAKIAPSGKAGGQPGEKMAVPVTPRNAWVSFQLVIHAPKGKAGTVRLDLRSPAYVGGPREHGGLPLFRDRAYRVWAVPKGGRPHPEVLVPVDAHSGKISIPWRENNVAEQDCQSILLDIWVPKNVPPGPYRGLFIVHPENHETIGVPIALNVAHVELPDEFRVVGDMNTYDSPARAMGAKTSDAAAFMEMERKYYRLAHVHRMTLNVLPYSQSGSINWRGAPKIGKDGRLDFSEWDERYRALISGEAFTAKQGYVGPGEGAPIHHMYLPFHENWPLKLAEHFKPTTGQAWPPPKDYDAFLKWSAELPPIEECLFRRPWGRVGLWHPELRAFAGHLGGRRTRFQIYLNNKYYFRRGGGRGISLWLLDEPMFADDFLALRYFAQQSRPIIELARRWRPPPARLDFRIDISRPTHQRQWLDGLVDLNVCADQLYSQRRLIAFRKRKFEEEYWNYRMPPSFAADNVAWAVWPVRSFCWGAAGTLPWQTIGSDGDLAQADETALMYPGRKFGLDEPVPSLRMKAWRDGLQTAELLRMLKAKMKWNDIQLRAFVGQVCGLSGWRDGMDPKGDAEIVTFAEMTTEKLSLLNRAAIHALVSAK